MHRNHKLQIQNTNIPVFQVPEDGCTCCAVEVLGEYETSPSIKPLGLICPTPCAADNTATATFLLQSCELFAIFSFRITFTHVSALAKISTVVRQQYSNVCCRTHPCGCHDAPWPRARCVCLCLPVKLAPTGSSVLTKMDTPLVLAFTINTLGGKKSHTLGGKKSHK